MAEAVPRRGSSELRTLLREVAIFSAAEASTIDALSAAAECRFVAAGDLLFKQGDVADGLAVVASGRLDIYFEDDAATTAGTAGHGDVIGELSLLSAGTRGASVRARRDSVVYQVQRGPFEAIMKQQPALALAIARNLSDRLRSSTPRAVSQHRPRVFAVTSVDGNKLSESFVRDLGDALGASATCVADASAVASGDDSARAEWLDRTEASGGAVVLVADRSEHAWLDFCLRSADRVVLVTRGRPDPALHTDVRFRGRDLVLIDFSASQARLRECLDLFQPARHYFIRVDETRKLLIERAARRMTGRSLGLVLSGGGARGLAHIGVIQRLVDAGIVIDRIGGCSMGALVGAMTAMNWPIDRIIDIVRDELVRQKPFSDYRLSRVSLIKAKRASSMLERILGDGTFEELDRPFFAVSSDLGSGELVTHRRGRLLDGVGASMSIPGLVPPRLHEGRWLVDGGVLDNLPVDVMARDAEGPVIAVDVIRDAGAVRVGKASPSMLDTIVRSTLIGGWERNGANRKAADVLVAPDVGTIGLLDFHRLDEAIASGQRAADTALDDVRTFTGDD